MYETLLDVVNASGIWKEGRIHSHSFRLSPSVYQISEDQHLELQKLGLALCDCLLGLSHMANIAYDPSLNYPGAWQMIRKVFSTGVPAIYRELQGMNVRHLPRLLKVDLMVDQAGNFKIAEIDGHNKHGLGYSTLGKRFRDALYPDLKAPPGVMSLLAKEVERQGASRLKLFYADQERFYVPEFEVAQQELARSGVEMEIMTEKMVSLADVGEGLFVDLPFLNKRSSLYQTIIPAYKAGDVKFVIAPKPFLGAKGVLALLRNDMQHPQLEAVLQGLIDRRSLELVRQYIPATYLVGQMAASFDDVKSLVAQRRYVLKESISSGMKGTVFSDDKFFDTSLSIASQTNLNWILQEEVENQPQTFSWYEGGRNGVPELRTADDWFMRVTVQYVNFQLADAIVTARRDKAVHGAPDCLQLGTVIV